MRSPTALSPSAPPFEPSSSSDLEHMVADVSCIRASTAGLSKYDPLNESGLLLRLLLIKRQHLSPESGTRFRELPPDPESHAGDDLSASDFLAIMVAGGVVVCGG